MSVLDKGLFATHLQRLQIGASQATALDEISRWISDNTYIGGKPYSYLNHEYQKRILDSTAREIVIRKCSQVGISEMSIRRSLAMCGMIRNFVTIYQPECELGFQLLNQLGKQVRLYQFFYRTNLRIAAKRLKLGFRF